MQQSKSEVAAQAEPIWAESPGIAGIVAPSSVVRMGDVEPDDPS
jgi:hypothetical protein